MIMAQRHILILKEKKIEKWGNILRTKYSDLPVILQNLGLGVHVQVLEIQRSYSLWRDPE